MELEVVKIILVIWLIISMVSSMVADSLIIGFGATTFAFSIAYVALYFGFM